MLCLRLKMGEIWELSCRTLRGSFSINRGICSHSLKRLIKTQWRGLGRLPSSSPTQIMLWGRRQSLGRFKNTCRNKPPLTSHQLRSAVITPPRSRHCVLSSYTYLHSASVVPTARFVFPQSFSEELICELWSVIYHIIDHVCWWQLYHNTSDPVDVFSDGVNQ